VKPRLGEKPYEFYRGGAAPGLLSLRDSSRPMICRLHYLCLCLFLVLSQQVFAAPNIDIEYAEWGFDGRAVPGRFNLLSVEIRNSGDMPFEGTLSLRRLLTTAGAWTGIEHAEAIFVGPFSQKLVYFYPYILVTADEWELRWGESLDDTYVVERPALSNGDRVILNDQELLSGIIPGLKGSRDDLFPPTVTGTDTLRTVVLDHTPRWEEPRRRAFRDWLYLGGVLHVLHENTGDFPVLPVEALNGPDRVQRYGAGRVFWHDRQRADLSREYVYETIYATSRDSVSVAAPGNVSLDVDPTARKYYTRLNALEFYEAAADWHSEEVIPARLRELVTPAHNWLLIYVLSGAYLLLIYPGGVLLNRTRLDYRFGMVALVAIVGLWSWMFLAIGSRGYGETTSTCTAAAVRQLPDGRWDVEQWSSLFVTTGDNYSLAHPGESVAYSTTQSHEQIEGRIENGQPGFLSVDMPPFTFRTFAHRNQVKMSSVEVSISNVDFGLVDKSKLDSEFAPLITVDANVTGSLPGPVSFGHVVYRDHIYRLNPDAFDSGSGNLIAGEPAKIHSVFRIDRRFRRFPTNVRQDPAAGLDRFAVWMMARNLQIRRNIDVSEFRFPPNRMRVFLYGELPEALRAVDAVHPDEPLGKQFGRVLYCIDVLMPDA